MSGLLVCPYRLLSQLCDGVSVLVRKIWLNFIVLACALTPILVWTAPTAARELADSPGTDSDYAPVGRIAQAETAWLLPDLLTLPPADLEIHVLRNGGRQLRLDNTIWNHGPGKLELAGAYNRATGKTTVRQFLYSADGSVLERIAGEFVFHPGHSHWHFEDFALYELWSVSPYGDLEDRVATSEKLSYCLLDTHIIERSSLNFARWGEYYICGQSKQGLSVGWGDTYDSFLDGQSLDISALADGVYALVSTANPTRSVLEASYDNNTAATYIRLSGENIVTLPSPAIGNKRCVETGWC